MGVPQVMQPDSRKSAAECLAIEELADRFGIDRFTVFVREHRIVDSDGLTVALLTAAPSGEDLLGGGVEIDRPSACGGVGRDFHGCALDALPATRNRESVRVDVPVAPSSPAISPRRIPVVAAR